MFFLHSSNKTENLLYHLQTVVETEPLSDPFAAEVFLIQSQGMERWLSQQMASAFQVWGHYQFLFPSKFFAELADRLQASLVSEAFDRHLMLWRFEAALRDLDEDAFDPLNAYLQGDELDIKRFQLARQLAKIYDQYQMMRPQMLTVWQQGELLYHTETERWQAALWRKITQNVNERHRGELFLQVIARLKQTEAGQLNAELPQRLSVFGINSMPPLLLNFLQALSQHCDVHFYLLNPAQEYWADLPARKMLDADETVDAHPLLAALGQQGREFQQMLLEQVSFELEFDSFEESAALNNLQQLQNDLLANRRPQLALSDDGSIRINACHSRMREVQVVKSQLLSALEADSDLQLRDIVVMAPDIQQYEPYIAAVFDDIQHAIADRSLQLSNRALEVFLRFLQVSQSRFGWQAVLDILEHPLVHPNFDLQAQDLELIAYWVAETRVRWGQSAEHKERLELPPLQANTWQAAMERLLMGYAVAGDDQFVAEVLPFSAIEGSSAAALGGLYDFLQLLFKAEEVFRGNTDLAQWSELLLDYSQRLLTQTESIELQQLNELLLELSDKNSLVHQHPVSLTVIIQWLESRVSETKSSNGFLRGQLTFCSMLPMRSIPFKVIALMGMNEGEFPSRDYYPTFDLMGAHYQLGDRSQRADDRYQFLEILLSTQQQLIISYIGQSIRDNSEIPPSVIISEMLDVLGQDYQLDELIIKHPLQAFSQRYFNQQEPQLWSYSQNDCETARQLQQPKQAAEFWWRETLEEKPENIIEISELMRFFNHPQRYFLRHQLDLKFFDAASSIEEREPFALEFPDNYQIPQLWIERQLNRQDLALDLLTAEGKWPQGAPGQRLYDSEKQDIEEFTEQIQQLDLGERLADQFVEFNLEEFTVAGTLADCYQRGVLRYRYADAKGKDFFAAWLQHLLSNQVSPQHSYFIAKDRQWHFLPEDSQASDLTALLRLYQQGLQSPMSFFVEPAFAYIQKKIKAEQSSRTTSPPLADAQQALQKMWEYDKEIRLLFPQAEMLDDYPDESFGAQTEALLATIWRAVNDRTI